jgi:hypothetical protein
MKDLHVNEKARRDTFGIFDVDEDGVLSAGELFMFHKFSIFFQQLIKGGIHLIYSRNLELDIPEQAGMFEIALFKEE